MERWKNEGRTQGSLQSEAEWRKLNAHHAVHCAALTNVQSQASCWSTPERVVCYEMMLGKVRKNCWG